MLMTLFATVDQKRRKLGDKLLAVATYNEFVLWAQTQLGQQEVAARNSALSRLSASLLNFLNSITT